MADEDPKLGRPPREFTEKEVRQVMALARCHCPDDEIAAFLECGETTVKRHFGPLLKECRLQGRANLRAWQFREAEKGVPTMLIWLGKQLLGQRDRHDVNVTNEAEEAYKRQLAEMSPQQLAQLAEKEVADLRAKTTVLANVPDIDQPN
jgi:hypothetical protein